MNSWKIKITDDAREQILALGKASANRIMDYLYERLPNAPHPRALGKALTGKYTGYWRYRVGDLRIICDIRDNVLWIVVVMAGRRDKIYKRPIPKYNDPEEENDR